MIPEQFLNGISELVIDASSMIYHLKIGLLGSLGAEIHLISTPQVIEETGWNHLPVESRRIPEEQISNDDSLICLAVSGGSPVLSEDYEVLMNAKEAGLGYYNTLMMLNYLLLKGRISPEEYPEYLKRLKECSHYSEKVLSQGALVHQAVLEYLELYG